jgi:two-component system CheB/CheR fusion protein
LGAAAAAHVKRGSDEFQAANRELEMSKDDLKSRNAELTARNGELHATVERQRVTFRGLQNILDSTDVATLFRDTLPALVRTALAAA